MHRRTLATMLGLSSLVGCDPAEPSGGAPQQPSPTQVAEPPATPAESPAAATPAATALPQAPALPPAAPAPTAKGETARVPAGKLVLGSSPVAAHRNAALEADGVSIDMPAFEIDRLPYPNDPGAPPMTGVTRPEAAKLCAEAGKRLCTEAQWERACKTDAQHAYPTGDALDLAACTASLPACGNALGAMAMGIATREWTASEWPQGFGNAMRTAVTRGSSNKEDATAHRCAARSGATADSTSDGIGFRCCSGDAARFEYPTEPRRRQIAPLEVDLDAIKAALATHPKLAPLAPQFKPFNGADIARALARGKRSRGNITAWHIADSTFVWSPGQGQQLWVVSGSSGDRSLVAALHVMPDGSLQHAASTVIDEPDMSVALGYTEDKPLQLLWTTCFGCEGEGGDLRVADDGRIGFTYR